MSKQLSGFILAVSLPFCLMTFARAQSRADSLRQDLTFLRTILQENYPSLYRYTTKTELDRQFANCYASVNNNTTDLEFLKSIKFLFSAIKDGHLYCGPSAQLRQYMNQQAKLFPLKMQFIGNKAYLLSSSGDSLPAGTEIISIDHKPVDELRKHLFSYIVADGSIETKKYHILDYSFRYYYLTAFGERPYFDITYRSAKGVFKTIKINAVPAKEISKEPENNEPADLLKLDFRDHIALLTIKTFDSVRLAEAKENYPAFLASSFEEINRRKVKKLIIDLRGNGGGRDIYGSLLYTYLAAGPFPYYKELTCVTRNLPYTQFRSDNSSYNNLDITMLDSVGIQSFRLSKTAHTNLQLLQPRRNNFNGTVWFLIDGQSFSSTAEFCAVARSNERGKFIGEETGGAYYGNTSGMQIDTTLPNTKINISFGTIGYEMAVNKTKHKDRGIIPDYIITPSINDLLNKKDPQLDFALKLAGEEK